MSETERIYESLVARGGVRVQVPYDLGEREVRVLMLRPNRDDVTYEIPVVTLDDVLTLMQASGCNYDCDSCRED